MLSILSPMEPRDDQHWTSESLIGKLGDLPLVHWLDRTRDRGCIENPVYTAARVLRRVLLVCLEFVRELLRLSDDRQQQCSKVDQVARIHLAEVESKIADLTALRGKLRQLIEQCRHGTIAECRIINTLTPRV